MSFMEGSVAAVVGLTSMGVKPVNVGESRLTKCPLDRFHLFSWWKSEHFVVVFLFCDVLMGLQGFEAGKVALVIARSSQPSRRLRKGYTFKHHLSRRRNEGLTTGGEDS